MNILSRKKWGAGVVRKKANDIFHDAITTTGTGNERGIKDIFFTPDGAGIKGKVRAIHGPTNWYDTVVLRPSSDKRSATWSCTCKWGQWAHRFARLHLRGRYCSHAIALALYYGWHKSHGSVANLTSPDDDAFTILYSNMDKAKKDRLIKNRILRFIKQHPEVLRIIRPSKGQRLTKEEILSNQEIRYILNTIGDKMYMDRFWEKSMTAKETREYLMKLMSGMFETGELFEEIYADKLRRKEQSETPIKQEETPKPVQSVTTPTNLSDLINSVFGNTENEE